MQKTLVLVAALAVVATASASVQIFYSTQGLTDPNYALLPTNGNGTDIQDGNWLIDGTGPAFGHVYVYDTWNPHTVYVWLKFNGEPSPRKINGLDMDASDGAPDAAAWYLLENGALDGHKRWDGAYTPPNAPEFQTPHKVLVAATADGVVNFDGSNLTHLWIGGTYREALSGAVRFPAGTDGEFTLALGTAGISYTGGYPAPSVEFGSIFFGIPEPASILLLGAAGTLLRRR